MDFDFSGLCADQVFKLEKRLEALKKAYLKEYQIALNVINDEDANKCIGEITQQISDLLSDQNRKTAMLQTECMNKIQRLLGTYLS